MSTIITGERHLQKFQLMQHIYALKIEIDTGLRHSRGSVLRSAQDKYGIKSRTKRGAYKELRELLTTWDLEDGMEPQHAGKAFSFDDDEPGQGGR